MELRQISENRVQTSFSIAINRNFRNNQGSVDADFVPCVAWGRLAERIVKYCGKGSLVGINGRLQSRSYMNRDNLKVYTVEVVVDDVRFIILKSPQNDVVHREMEQRFEMENEFILPENGELASVP